MDHSAMGIADVLYPDISGGSFPGRYSVRNFNGLPDRVFFREICFVFKFSVRTKILFEPQQAQ